MKNLSTVEVEPVRSPEVVHVESRISKFSGYLYVLAWISGPFSSNFHNFFNTRLFQTRTPPNERADTWLSFGYILAANGAVLKKSWIHEVARVRMEEVYIM